MKLICKIKGGHVFKRKELEGRMTNNKGETICFRCSTKQIEKVA